MNAQKKHTRGAFWGFLVAGPILLPLAIALSPLLLIPLNMWVFLRCQNSWEERRSGRQKRSNQEGLVLVHAQKGKEGLLMNIGNSLGVPHHSQVLNVQGEIVLLVFPNGEAGRVKEYLLGTLAGFPGHSITPEMIVFTPGLPQKTH